MSCRPLALAKVLLISLFITSCVGCDGGVNKKAQADVKTIMVSKQANVDTLYLNGTIEPIKIISVIAPFDGTVAQQFFDYGELLQKGQLLLTINSSQFNDSYQETFASYLKAKRDYANNQSKMRGTEELKRLGIISKDEYSSDKNQMYDSSLSLAQATRKLQDLLQKANNNIDLSKLNTDDTQAITKLLQTNSQQLKIYSPSDGIALLPVKTAVSDDSNKPLHIGDQIKTGQALLTVGDISGIVLSVKINEIHINDIQAEQQATISSNAFKYVLQGKVIHVDQQATQDTGDNTPTFTVKIVVPKVTAMQRKDIHVGMSAKVAVQITKPSAITVPINAVINKDGQTLVKVLDKSTKKIKEIPVTAGATSLDTVVIQQGLKPGDEVVIDADNRTTAN